MDRPHIAFDLETYPIRPGRQVPRPVSVAWCGSEIESLEHLNPAITKVGWDSAYDRLTEASRGGLVLVGLNVPYDLACLAEWAPDDPMLPLIFEALDNNGVLDVGVRQQLLDNAAGNYSGVYRDKAGNSHKIKYSLAALAKRHLDIDMAKGADTWRLRYGELWDVPVSEWPAEAVDYATLDGMATHGVFCSQEKTRRPEALVDQYRQTRAMWVLRLIAYWGIRTDKAGVAFLRKKTEQELAKYDSLLKREGLIRSNGSKNMKAIYDKIKSLDDPTWPMTEKGKPKTSKEVLGLSTDESLQALLGYQTASSLLTGGIVHLERGINVPIHTRFNTLLRTGRVSSSKQNIQNVRREPGARECFVPRPGFLFAACDFDKAELHSLAEVCYHLFGHSRLGDRLNDGFDPHIDMGRKVLAREMESMTYDEMAANLHVLKVKKARSAGKPINFGVPGGLGPSALRSFAWDQYRVRFSEQEARELHSEYFNVWPEMREYFKWVNSLLGRSQTCTVKQLYSDRIRGGCRYTQAANTMFQGLTADAAKTALYEVAREQYTVPSSPLWGCRTVNFVHDELIVEVPDHLDKADAAARRLQEVMVKAYNRWVPRCPVSAEAVLMRRWSKEAKPTYDKQGRLIPWEDACDC